MDPGVKYANESIALSAKMLNPHLQARAYLSMGNIYFQQADSKNSLNNFIKALRYAELANDSNKVAEIYHKHRNIVQQFACI